MKIFIFLLYDIVDPTQIGIDPEEPNLSRRIIR